MPGFCPGLLETKVPTKEDIAALMQSAYDQLKKLCSESCLKKCTAGCKPDQCKKEAALLAKEYINYVLKVARPYDPQPKKGDDRRFGYVCSQWMGLMLNMVAKLQVAGKLKCFYPQEVGTSLDGKLKHMFLRISVTGNDAK